MLYNGWAECPQFPDACTYDSIICHPLALRLSVALRHLRSRIWLTRLDPDLFRLQRFSELSDTWALFGHPLLSRTYVHCASTRVGTWSPIDRTSFHSYSSAFLNPTSVLDYRSWTLGPHSCRLPSLSTSMTIPSLPSPLCLAALTSCHLMHSDPQAFALIHMHLTS